MAVVSLHSYLFADANILQESDGSDLINSFVGRHPFASVAADNDQGRRARLHGRSPEEMEVLELQRKYDILSLFALKPYFCLLFLTAYEWLSENLPTRKQDL